MSGKMPWKRASNNALKKRTKLLACFFRPLFQAIKMSWGQKFWPTDESAQTLHSGYCFSDKTLPSDLVISKAPLVGVHWRFLVPSCCYTLSPSHSRPVLGTPRCCWACVWEGFGSPTHSSKVCRKLKPAQRIEALSHEPLTTWLNNYFWALVKAKEFQSSKSIEIGPMQHFDWGSQILQDNYSRNLEY